MSHPAQATGSLTPAQFEDLLGQLSAICRETEGTYEPYAAPWDEVIKEEYDLPELGMGAARTASYVQVEGHPPLVLKVINNADGLGQQRHELVCLLAGAGCNPLVPKVYRWGPSAAMPCWIVVEYLDDATDEDWRRVAGVAFDQIVDALGNCWLDDDSPRGPPCYRKELARQGVRPEFARALDDAIRLCRLDIEEVEEPHHWGLSVDGMLKLRDLGAQEQYADWARDPSAEYVAVKERLLGW